MEPEYRCWSRGIRQGNLQRPFAVFEPPLSRGSGFEWLVCPLALNNLTVELGEVTHEFLVVLSDRFRPPVAVRNGLVEFLVQRFQVRVCTVIHRVVELRQADLVLHAECAAEQREHAADICRMLSLLRSALCMEHQVGLTKLYNAMDDGAYADLKALHKELDEAVADCYGWPKSVAQDDKELVRHLTELNRQIIEGERAYAPFD